MRSRVWLAAVGALIIMAPFAACGAPETDEFAIYLLKDNAQNVGATTPDLTMLSNSPIISTADILSYDRATHTMELTPQALQRVAGLRPPVNGGMPFAVCVGQRPIYSGAFWTPMSSVSFDGVVIEILLSNKPDPAHTLKLQLGYPDNTFYIGSDLRSSPILMNTLERAGKLK